MGKVIGVGGIFMTCADAAATRDWDTRVSGFTPDAHGGFSFLHADSAAAFPEGARTIFAPFGAEGNYFAPSELPFMINLIVDDLDAMLARAAAQGVAEVKPREAYAYGSFGWVMDPDGRKVELWQPPG